jgi:hypothetical protein
MFKTSDIAPEQTIIENSHWGSIIARAFLGPFRFPIELFSGLYRDCQCTLGFDEMTINVKDFTEAAEAMPRPAFLPARQIRPKQVRGMDMVWNFPFQMNVSPYRPCNLDGMRGWPTPQYIHSC